MNLTDLTPDAELCRERVLSENIYDYITDYPLSEFPNLRESVCHAEIDDLYNILYLPRNSLNNPDTGIFQYQSVPKLYGLMQTQLTAGTGFNPSALIAAGILEVQRPPLELTGRGCVICFIDTGINYTNPVFSDETGNSRILALWDQTDRTGTPPEGFLYGSEYTREDINRALRSEEPLDIVPERDEVGHGTVLAALAAGSNTGAYLGAAPSADLVVVKLKEAKSYLRRFYAIPDSVHAYQENDIMLAVQYGDRFAAALSRPVIYSIGLGTNMGDHEGSSALARYLDQVAARRSRAVVVCGGNEGNSAHHFRGQLTDKTVGVEVRVGEKCSGFTLECWGSLPDTLEVAVRSPGGETVPAIPLNATDSATYGLVYEKTIVTLTARLTEASTGSQLLRFRLEQPTPGIWMFLVSSSREIYNGVFDMWLPIDAFLDVQVYFLAPTPYITLTEPAMAGNVIGVSAYDPANRAFAITSGRGYDRQGAVRPDLAAPGVNVPTIRGTESGCSLAAALTAGAAAQLLQWAVVEGNDRFAESRVLKSYLIRGAARDADLSYPNREWGYGRLDISGTFERLRRT